jgi:hypothetical protein
MNIKSKAHWRWWYWLLIMILLPFVALGGYIAFVINRHYLPRFDLPPFDAAKAAQLSPEKRAAYEQELFSELSRWNKESRRYPNREDFILREKRWQQMADEGVELAHITLQVLQPSTLQVYSLRGPMRRLEELAEQGDTAAMCLMLRLVAGAASKLNVDRYDPIYKKWMERGAELGHPECMLQMGTRLMLGGDGYEKDYKQGMNLQFAAHRAGYAHDAWPLIRHYEELEKTPRIRDGRSYVIGAQRRYYSIGENLDLLAYRNLDNVRRLYCWQQMNAKFRISDEPDELLADLQIEAQRTGRTDLAALYEELRGKHYSLQDCVNLGMGE